MCSYETEAGTEEPEDLDFVFLAKGGYLAPGHKHSFQPNKSLGLSLWVNKNILTNPESALLVTHKMALKLLLKKLG